MADDYGYDFIEGEDGRFKPVVRRKPEPPPRRCRVCAGRVRIVHPSGRSDVEISDATGGRNTEPGSRYMARVGKKAAGHLLDGRAHREWPR